MFEPTYQSLEKQFLINFEVQTNQNVDLQRWVCNK